MIQKIFEFHNGTSTISAGNELSVCPNDVTMNLAFTGTGTFTAIFEGKVNDDNNWYTIQGVNLYDYSMGTSVSALASIWQVAIEGFIKVRVRVSAISGTLTVKGTVYD